MKKTMMFLGVLSLGLAHAQQYDGKVGINTDTPNATLDVKSIATDETKGILIPQLTGDKLREMTTNLTADQHGLITFATNGVTALDNVPTNNVQFLGYHRFNVDGNNKSWVRLEPSGLEKVKGNGTNIGWRLVGNNADTRFAPVGNRAIDMSFVTDGTERGASGNYSLSVGANNKATNSYSVAIGGGLTSTGNSSVAMGLNSSAKGAYSFAVGYKAQANGAASVAFGSNNISDKDYTFSHGLSNQALKAYSVAIGYQNIVNAEGAYALGRTNNVEGRGAVAIGNSNNITGQYAYALGLDNRITSPYSMAVGYRTAATTQGMMAVGIANTEGGKAFVVGNGVVLGNEINRSDAFAVLRDGRVGVDIDNFETTTFDAKLQVNGKILANSLAGTGDRPVYADENGVLKIGSATSTGATQLSGTDGIECNEENRGKMNFKKGDSGKSDVFGVCLKHKDGSYNWAYLVGGHHLFEGTGVFGDGL